MMFCRIVIRTGYHYTIDDTVIAVKRQLDISQEITP